MNLIKKKEGLIELLNGYIAGDIPQITLDERGDISHFNKVLKVEVFEPHVHDPHALGGIRPADYWEIPK